MLFKNIARIMFGKLTKECDRIVSREKKAYLHAVSEWLSIWTVMA
jgi:hypothetical protein